MTTDTFADRDEMALKMQRQQRLALIGQLAAGAAHEVNNALMIMMASATTHVADEPPDDARLRSLARVVMRECHRIQAIMRQSTSPFRGHAEPLASEDMAAVVRAALDSSSAILRREQVRVDADIVTDLPRVMCHGHEIQQILINLLINASHALTERFPGAHADKLISVTMGIVDKHGAPYLRITVEDRGSGIPAGMLPHIFQPLFTTKRASVGNGFGLPVSREIARAHHGDLWAESEPGSRTRFHLDLPVLDPEGNADAALA